MPTLQPRHRLLAAICIAWSFLFAALSHAAPEKPLPPPGNAIGAADRAELEAGVAALQKTIAGLQAELAGKPKLLALLPDVQIYLNAVRYPLVYHEAIDVAKAKAALVAGNDRAKSLRDGKAPWVTAGGARGYLSKIDNSVQPYLLALPKRYQAGDGKKHAVLIFCHGRGEDLLELKFIDGRAAMGSANQTSIPDAFFVQPYGRYCCANKFAGEIDTLEILDSLRAQYGIDDNRIAMTGFSMGGAAVWHLAVHYADQWCVASPGAGFCETKIYQKITGAELAATPWYEQVLWHWYDAPDYILNLSNTPLIAYAGTDDPQQQSGTIMEKAAAAEGVPFSRIWGQNVGHKYEPAAKAELDKRLAECVAKGRNPTPMGIRFETRTLRYNRSFWVTVDSLDKHWEQTVVEALIIEGEIQVATKNVAAMTFSFAPGTFPYDREPGLKIDGAPVAAAASVGADKSYRETYVKTNGTWKAMTTRPDAAPLVKRHGLQGPIDDAFLDSFIIVKPTRDAMNAKTGAWATAEMSHAIQQWHSIFRGEAPVTSDAALTDAQIASSNLVLFGDPASNRVLEKILPKLPIQWTAQKLTLGAHTFDAATHVPILIYPNPLNPKKYIVINSGFTFREDANGTNSRQVPRLPDYAIVDVTMPPNSHSPGKIETAGFFGEKWEVQADDGKIAP